LRRLLFRVSGGPWSQTHSSHRAKDLSSESSIRLIPVLWRHGSAARMVARSSKIRTGSAAAGQEAARNNFGEHRSRKRRYPSSWWGPVCARALFT
jgi:hypothetical protein